ncbi:MULTISPECIES: sigma-70 family RNA polymerase sigma factor [unclassified Moraxella]|uniref:sigma-70 family RNA polymerase sigma factor n=1 Tax=unclassified Moraxella TaxID=2685852 RepID=UPI002B41569E|nr:MULTISPECIES: sigma-70 family RNA polymerase sigma factor [unclassified Moraxella]
MNDDNETFIRLLKDSKTHSMHHSLNDDYLLYLYKELLKFAKNQLNDTNIAEDIVQEALTTALRYQTDFQGKSALKTWVFAILKNKIIDYLRQKNRYVPLTDLTNDDNNDSDELVINTLFTQDGSWHKSTRPTAFDERAYNPEIQAQNDGFWQVLEVCLNNLPAEHAKIFLMKEYLELDTEEICESCQISKQNFYVIMCRARLRLQVCLQIKWFDDENL